MSPLSPHTADSVAGYTLIERIGAGGYGEVWKAEAPGGLAKAVKLVYGYLDDQRAACERKSLNRIKEARHPFLLSLERIEIVDGQLVVVTELADMSLKERFEQCRGEGSPGIPREELLVYMGDAADALDYMRESHGLQHLDVKPENLLVTSGRVKVADFGLVKSLQEDNASLLGGLTPQYAPPELFDSNPTSSSDQYSLAIVYQEMLTGKPPFPGRTAAQLATQHLHSQPQLNPLPQDDRDVVARALAKKPSDRFASCREMVDALRGANSNRLGTSSGGHGAGTGSQAVSSDTSSIKDKDTHPTMAAPGLKSPADPLSRRSQTMVLGESGTEQPGECPAPGPVSCRELPPATDPVRLPPVEIPAHDQDLAPSLVLGMGGIAADVFRDLRRRILRDEKSFRQENLDFLLLDTDGAAIESACGDRCEDSLEFRETLHLPLRPSVEYREQSADHLQWLSRRWLYNIPRSLKTEGRRPLGRLAFADHANRIRKRLREALLSTADKVRLGETASGDSHQDLRIFIVASTGGGTGGGMVADMGYLVRELMDELGLASTGVCAVLIHGTNTNPDQQDLTIANTYACLSELNHHATSGYTGDPSCRLAPSNRLPFDQTYLVHLGNDLDARSYGTAVTEVAEYLYLNAASSAGHFFDAVRSSGNSPEPGSGCPLPLRTFGLIQFDPHHNTITSLAVEELSRSVVSQWLGGDRFFAEQTVEDYLKREFPELAENSKASKAKRKKKRSKTANQGDHKTGLQYLLDPDTLRSFLSAAMEEQLGGPDTDVFRRWIKLATSRKLAEKRPFLKELERSLGPRRRAGEGSDAPLSDLEQSLADSSAKVAVLAVESIRDVLLRLTSDPDSRIAGAQQAAQWMCDRLRQFERATSTEWTRVDEHLTSMEAKLPEKVTTGDGFWGRRSRRSDTWLDYCQLRAHLIILGSVARFVRRVNTHLSNYREQLKNAHFSLSRVASQFDSEEKWTATLAGSRSEGGEKKSLAHSIGGLIESQMPDLIAKLDQGLGDELIQLDSSRTAEETEQLNAQRFARTLRAKSWAVLAEALRELDLGSRMFAEDTKSVGKISDFLPDAVPRLPKSGGEKRLLVVAPVTTEEGTVRNGLGHCEDGEFSLVRTGESELALCYEIEGLDLPVVATRLVENRENCILAAGRLHTRIDVAWPEQMVWK